MSRTYRKSPQWYYKLHGQFYYDKDFRTRTEWREMYDIIWRFRPAFGTDYNCKGDDHKPWNKPPRWYKRIQRRGEKAKMKQAVHRMTHDPEGDSVIQDYPKHDVWDWT